MKRNRILPLLPMLSALYWGSCYNPWTTDLAQRDRDLRSFICALCLSSIAYIVAKAFLDEK
jgi:hypothetical protein